MIRARSGGAWLAAALAVAAGGCAQGVPDGGQGAAREAAIASCAERHDEFENLFSDNPVWAAVTYDLTDLDADRRSALIAEFARRNAALAEEANRGSPSGGRPVDLSPARIENGTTYGRSVVFADTTAQAIREVCSTVPAGLRIHQITMGVPRSVRS